MAERPFDIPSSIFPEFHSQPIEQLGMARQIALNTEVFRGLHEAVAEQHLPESIHSDTRGERVLGRDEPVSEIQSIEPRGP